MTQRVLLRAVVSAGAMLLAFSATSAPVRRPGAGWTSNTKIACAYFYYWYDVYSGAHFKNGDGSDGLTDHPPPDALANYSYTDPAWWRRELLDMTAAGIDVILPVYWGDRVNAAWSKPGLQNLVAAALQLEAEGTPPPRIGMFLDTTSLRIQYGGRPDLKTSRGRAIFSKMISDFWTIVPRSLWAAVDDKPLTFLYTADQVRDYNQKFFNLVSERFGDMFGASPYFVRESSWEDVRTDGAYVWGVALSGPRTRGQVGSLGPGYNDRAVAARPVKHVRDRECGDIYRAAWDEIAASGVTIAAIETWNEWHEATEVAPSYEYGRRYLDLTAEGIRRWKAADYSSAPYVWIDYGRFPYAGGLRPALNALEGTWKARILGNREGVYPDHASKPSSSFLYLDVSNEFISARASEVWITVEYFDRGTDGWTLEYDGVADPYTKAGTVTLTDTGKWRRKTIHLRDAFFGGGQNYGADFRIGDDLAVDGRINYFGRVWVSKAALSNKQPALIWIGDVETAPNRVAEIPLITSDPEGQPVSLTLDPPLPFTQILAAPGGNSVLQLQAGFGDSRLCPYRLRIIATDSGTPPLSDAITILVRVRS
jgi:hypothetical protein